MFFVYFRENIIMDEGQQLARIQRNALIFLGIFAAALAVLEGIGGGASVLLGGGVAWIGFGELKRSVDGILGSARGPEEVPSAGAFAVRFLVRLVLILVVVFAMIQLSFISLLGVLLGLSVFILAGIFEAFQLLFEGRV